MEKFLVLAISFISIACSAQEPVDMIVTNSNDTILCSFKKGFDSTSGYLSFEKKDGSGASKVPLSMVKDYRYNGEWNGNNQILETDFYEDSKELLLKAVVLDELAFSQSELVQKFKNWGQTALVDFDEVIKGETDNQITLSFLLDYSYSAELGVGISTNHYIRLVCQFKDGKMRALFYDDGNPFFAGNQYGPSVAARSWHLVKLFRAGVVSNEGNQKVDFRRIRAFSNEFTRFAERFSTEITTNSDW